MAGPTAAVWALRQDPGALFSVDSSGDTRRVATFRREVIAATAAPDGSLWLQYADSRRVAHVRASGRVIDYTARRPVIRFIRVRRHMFFVAGIRRLEVFRLPRRVR